jgi:hypothetical protein
VRASLALLWHECGTPVDQAWAAGPLPGAEIRLAPMLSTARGSDSYSIARIHPASLPRPERTNTYALCDGLWSGSICSGERGVATLDKKEFLWNMYNEHVTQGRHHETQRTAVVTVVLALAGAVIAYLAQAKTSAVQWPMSVFLIILGIFGAGFSLKQTERADARDNR